MFSTFSDRWIFTKLWYNWHRPGTMIPLGTSGHSAGSGSNRISSRSIFRILFGIPENFGFGLDARTEIWVLEHSRRALNLFAGGSRGSKAQEVGAVCPVHVANSEIGDDRKTRLYFILEFKIFIFGRVTANLHLRTKFTQNRMIFCWHMAISRFLRWRRSAILNFTGSIIGSFKSPRRASNIRRQ